MSKHLHLWLIDDDDTFIMLFETALASAIPQKNAYTFRSFENSDEALQLLHGDQALQNGPPRPDLIFLDHRLHRSDGWEVLKQLKTHEATQYIPVCMLSSSANPKELRLCYGNGANACMTKPMSFKDPGPKLKLTYEFFAEVFETPT